GSSIITSNTNTNTILLHHHHHHTRSLLHLSLFLPFLGLGFYLSHAFKPSNLTTTTTTHLLHRLLRFCSRKRVYYIMPALVDYCGDDDLCSGGSLYANSYPMDSSLLLSLGPHVDLYCPPRKRSRITAPFVFRNDIFECKQKPSINVLPDECLFEIFRRMPDGQDKSACACVSKRWLLLLSSIRQDECVVSEKEGLPQKIDNKIEMISGDNSQESENDGYLTRSLEGKKATDIRLAAIAVGTGGRGGLGKLLIRGSNPTRGVTDLGLSAIARRCPSLKILSVWNVSSFSDEGLAEIASSCHMLEKLDLVNCPSISNKGLISIAENCPNLTSLTIESCSNIGNEGLQAIGSRCPKLQYFAIKDCLLVGDQGVASLVSSASKSLMKIKIQAMNITDVSLAVIGHYGQAVTDLVLAGLQNVSERGFWVMGNTNGLQKVKSLTITSCRGVTDLGLEAVAKGCLNLKQLCLRRCSFVSDNGLVAFAKSATSLESLQLEECNRISLSGILGCLTNSGSKLKVFSIVKCMGIKDSVSGLFSVTPCKSLRSLSVRNCPGFGTTSLAMVGKLCPELQNLDLSGQSGVSDVGFLPLLENSVVGLVKVNLSDCVNLTDSVVSAMARLHGATLESLNLDGCKNITDASLVVIAQNCLFLRDLDVSKSAITDFGVAALSCAKQLNLQILSLSGCTRISGKSSPYLEKLGQTLLGLSIQHCNLISSSTVEFLVGHLWRCDILA
ncbi:hypothetical protein GIB67_017808, partial [Kingdonia uniflora]